MPSFPPTPPAAPRARGGDTLLASAHRPRPRALVFSGIVGAVLLAGAAFALGTRYPQAPVSGTGTSVSAASAPPTLPAPEARPTQEFRSSDAVLPIGTRRLRVSTRVAENQSNVSAEVIQRSVDVRPSEYLRCYRYSFSSLKEPPTGTVEVSFDILDQVPRRAKATASSFENPEFDTCVITALTGRTLHAAGPGGAGRVVYHFRFDLID